jgi:hypothetical protein
MSTIAKMKSARRWLLASPEKVPHYCDGTRRRGVLDSPQDLAMLSTYSDAKAASAAFGLGWNLGFALGADGEGGCWHGVDFDKVSDNLLIGLADALPGYVETSPSGEGLHAIGYGRHFDALGPNGSGIEAYAGRRYFTVTGHMVRDSQLTCLADHVENHLARHHKALATQPARATKSAEGASNLAVWASAQAIADLRSALLFMRSDDYAHWIAIGHALKPLGDTGRGLWLEWSATSVKFDSQEAARKWDSFDPGHTGHQSVFARAQALGWVNPAAAISTAAMPLNSDAPASVISATPFAMPAIGHIPPRPWIFGRWLMRGTVTTVIAPGGVGKSALMVATALSLATGSEFLGKTVWGGAKRVWLWNLEDDRDELGRQISAGCDRHNLTAAEFVGRLFVDDASSRLRTATKSRDGLQIHSPTYDAVLREISSRDIDVLIIDPFVSSHQAEENDNGQIDAIAKEWARIAREADCSVVLVHHSRKLGGQQADAEAARGASALGNAARAVLVLNGMEKSEAVRLGVSEDERRHFIRVSNSKANRSPANEADWFRKISVKLPNGGPEGGDDVVAIERWMPPEFSGCCDDDTKRKIQDVIAGGEWREHASAANWVGVAVADVIGADISDVASHRRVKAIIMSMISEGNLRVEQRHDAHRKLRPYIIVGSLIDTHCDSPAW